MFGLRLIGLIGGPRGWKDGMNVRDNHGTVTQVEQSGIWLDTDKL